MKIRMLVIFVLLFQGLLWSQTTYGTIQGTITDSDTSALDSVQIIIRSGYPGPGGAISDTDYTMANGTFHFDSLGFTGGFLYFTVFASRSGFIPDTQIANLSTNSPNDTVNFMLMAAPDQPVLIAVPSPTILRRPTLLWHSVAADTEYTIQISRSPLFFNNLINTITADTFFTPLTDLPLDTLYWRVSGSAAPTFFSETGSFIILDHSIPVLIPYTPDPTTDRRPTLVWHAVDSASGYTIVIDNSRSFGSPLVTMAVADTFFRPLTNLPLGMIFWRVQMDSTGTFSAPDSFSIISPNTPMLYAFNGDTVTVRRPLFQWKPLSGATTYMIEVDNSRNFGSPAISLSVSDTFFMPLADMANGKYFWRIRSDLDSTLYSAVDSLVVFPITGVESKALAPEALLAAAPNPFTDAVTIRFANPGKNARISIYAANGSRVFTLKNRSGNELTWNAGALPNGFYTVRVESGRKILSTRLVLLK